MHPCCASDWHPVRRITSCHRRVVNCHHGLARVSTRSWSNHHSWLVRSTRTADWLMIWITQRCLARPVVRLSSQPTMKPSQSSSTVVTTSSASAVMRSWLTRRRQSYCSLRWLTTLSSLVRCQTSRTVRAKCCRVSWWNTPLTCVSPTAWHHGSLRVCLQTTSTSIVSRQTVAALCWQSSITL